MAEATRATARLTVDGRTVEAPAGAMLAAMLWADGVVRGTRRSARLHEPRAALCGMGTCQECRVVVDGVPGVRACMVRCEDGLDVRTGDIG